jgi:hypothetical protein
VPPALLQVRPSLQVPLLLGTLAVAAAKFGPPLGGELPS